MVNHEKLMQPNCRTFDSSIILQYDFFQVVITDYKKYITKDSFFTFRIGN